MSEEMKKVETVEVTEETKDATVEAAPVQEKPATEAAPAETVKVSCFQKGKGFLKKNGKKIIGGIALTVGGLMVAGKVYKMIKGKPEVPNYEPMPMLEAAPVVPAIAETVVDTVVPAVTETVVPAVADVAETVTDVIPESLGIVD